MPSETSVNLQYVGGQPQTPRDWSADFQYIGTHRHLMRRPTSGWTDVPPKTHVYWLDVSGRGVVWNCMTRNIAGDIPPSDWYTFEICDGQAERDMPSRVPVRFQEAGITTEGMHTFGEEWAYIIKWTTVAPYAQYIVQSPHKYPFGSRLHCGFRNTNATYTLTAYHEVYHEILTSSKRFLCIADRWISAEEVRKRMEERLITHPIIVQRVGYFDDVIIDRHPYPDFIKEFKQRKGEFDVIIELFTDERVQASEVERRVRPRKVLYEEIIP